MGQVAAIISGKGGTGKTSLTAGIAGCLAAGGVAFGDAGELISAAGGTLEEMNMFSRSLLPWR